MTDAAADQTLVQQCLTGDDGAVTSFVRRFQGLVFSICLKMLQQREDAEDVAQESLTRAVRHLGRWDAERPLQPWVAMIAINRCRTHREQYRRRPIAVDELSYIADESSPPSIALAEELQRAIDGLREDYRTCFVLFHHQGLSIQEIADLLGSPTGTIKTWLHRARHLLAETLRQRGVVDEGGYELR